MSTQTLDSLCSINHETLDAATPMDMEFRYLDISAVTKGRIDWSATKLWKYADAPSRARRRLRSRDVLLCTVRPGLQAHARIQQEADAPLVGSTGFAVLRPKLAADSGFVFHQIFSDSVALQLRALETGSSYPAVNEGDVKRVHVYCPEKEERWRIAAVLDRVDEAIAKTEAVIAKLLQVRAGLLHDLLTRGLDKNGQLRDPIAHPEQFQESPLGRIPKEWTCKILGDAADWFSGGTPSRSQSAWWNGDVPILTPKDMKVFEISDTIEHVAMEAAVAGSKLMPPETAFIVVRGMILAHTFPVCLSTRPFAFNQDIKAVRGKDRLGTRFLAHWFAANASAFLRKTTEATHGTKKLDSKELYRSSIGVPEPDEQAAIVARIEAFDSAIAGDVQEVGKLHHLKSGLMTDLLTGRVRVPETIRITP